MLHTMLTVALCWQWATNFAQCRHNFNIRQVICRMQNIVNMGQKDCPMSTFCKNFTLGKLILPHALIWGKQILPYVNRRWLLSRSDFWIMSLVNSMTFMRVSPCVKKNWKFENCTILIPKGNSYFRRKSSARGPRCKVSSEGLSTEIDTPIQSPIQVQLKVGSWLIPACEFV